MVCLAPRALINCSPSAPWDASGRPLNFTVSRTQARPMSPTVWLYLSFVLALGLCCVGILSSAALVVALTDPRVRHRSLTGLRWGVLGGIPRVAVLTTIGNHQITQAEFPVIVGGGFFAGFAVGVLLWYLLRFRSSLSEGSARRQHAALLRQPSP